MPSTSASPVGQSIGSKGDLKVKTRLIGNVEKGREMSEVRMDPSAVDHQRGGGFTK
jgi:hypothetical protein